MVSTAPNPAMLTPPQMCCFVSCLRYIASTGIYYNAPQKNTKLFLTEPYFFSKRRICHEDVTRYVRSVLYAEDSSNPTILADEMNALAKILEIDWLVLSCNEMSQCVPVRYSSSMRSNSSSKCLQIFSLITSSGVFEMIQWPECNSTALARTIQ